MPTDSSNLATGKNRGDGSGGFTDSSNIQPTFGSTPINPDLAPLDYYGGPTQTMPPLPGSPVVGAAGTDADGFGSYSASLPVADQRGQEPANGFALDIGAVQDVPIIVSTENTDPVLPGQMSYQDAQNLAAALGGNPSTGYAYSSYTDLGYDQGAWVTYPTSVSEASDATLSFNKRMFAPVDNWNVDITTSDGSVYTDLPIINNTVSFAAAGQQQLIANITVENETGS
jgi:hypothetical protein